MAYDEQLAARVRALLSRESAPFFVIEVVERDELDRVAEVRRHPGELRRDEPDPCRQGDGEHADCRNPKRSRRRAWQYAGRQASSGRFFFTT